MRLSASRARSSSEANGPATKLTAPNSTPAWGCVGAIRSANTTAAVSFFNSSGSNSSSSRLNSSVSSFSACRTTSACR